MKDKGVQRSLRVIQIVRRFGPVGGMERYVWELVRELRDLGHEIEVLCEERFSDEPGGIVVHELGRIAMRPRWLSQIRFSRRVEHWLRKNPRLSWVIHSHERVNSHHITTFHGPPFAMVRDMPWWRKVSLRVAMRMYLERRELTVAHRIVPNSNVIRESLAHYYPDMEFKLTNPITPGVSAGLQREARSVKMDGGVIGFVGKEWKRKGLEYSIEIVAALRRARPNLQFLVIGPSASEVQNLFVGWSGGYKLLGWNDCAPFTEFDVLLHPARAEPYGMVISEAMAARVPVVVSDLCGAADQVSPSAGSVLPLSAPIADWVRAVDQQLCRKELVPGFERRWRTVAQEYEAVYRKLNV